MKYGAVIFLLVLAIACHTEAQHDIVFPPFTLPEEFVEGILRYLMSEAEDDGPVVKTSVGIFKGRYSDQGARVFKSIPYAQPPVDKLRWADPKKPVTNPSDTIMAIKDPAPCPQDCNILGCPSEPKEDCLYLNVYAPPQNNDQKYPVMVFIYGGAFILGSSTQTMYNGEYIASNTNTILVTFNYRLGALGFLAYNDGNGETIEGNFGFKDQQMALRWVKDNIENFGGDPNRVTLFGESAGAASVALHMTNSESAKLFNQAIIESDPFSIEYLKINKARKLGHELAKHLKCFGENTISCLRRKSAEDIVKQQAIVSQDLLICVLLNPFSTCEFETKFQLMMLWAPIIDGRLLVDQPIKLFATNKMAANIPLIIGTNSDEGRLLFYPFLQKISCLLWQRPIYRHLVYSFFRDGKGRGKAVFNEYYKPHSLTSGCKYYRDTFLDLMTDYMFVCPTRHAVNYYVNMADNNSEVKKWVYIFDQPLADHGIEKYKYCVGYACHGAELPYVFHTTDLVFGDNQTHNEEVLADIMTTYWTNFAHYGDPNAPCCASSDTSSVTGQFKKQSHCESNKCETTWPEYTASKPQIMVFNTESKITAAASRPLIDKYPQSEKCDFFDKLNGDKPEDAYNMCANDDC